MNAYQSQEAGYSGGSLFARDSVRDVQIVQIDLPSFRSGCGDIDFSQAVSHLLIQNNWSMPCRTSSIILWVMLLI